MNIRESIKDLPNAEQAAYLLGVSELAIAVLDTLRSGNGVRHTLDSAMGEVASWLLNTVPKEEIDPVDTSSLVCLIVRTSDK